MLKREMVRNLEIFYILYFLDNMLIFMQSLLSSSRTQYGHISFITAYMPSFHKSPLQRVKMIKIDFNTQMSHRPQTQYNIYYIII